MTVEVFSLYWHFVDVVWIFVFASLFLSVALAMTHRRRSTAIESASAAAAGPQVWYAVLRRGRRVDCPPGLRGLRRALDPPPPRLGVDAARRDRRHRVRDASWRCASHGGCRQRRRRSDPATGDDDAGQLLFLGRSGCWSEAINLALILLEGSYVLFLLVADACAKGSVISRARLALARRRRAPLAYAIGRDRWQRAHRTADGRPSRRRAASSPAWSRSASPGLATRRLADRSLTAHMVQHVVLLSVAGPLLALGHALPDIAVGAARDRGGAALADRSRLLAQPRPALRGLGQRRRSPSRPS